MSTPKWPFVLLDLFKVKLSTKSPAEGIDPEYVRWQEQISRGLDNLTDEDICRAIELAADDPELNRYKPDAKQVRIWIFKMWHVAKSERTQTNVNDAVYWFDWDGNDLTTLHPTHGRMSALQREIDEAAVVRAWDTMWDVISRPAGCGKCHELEAYAVREHGFSRDKVPCILEEDKRQREALKRTPPPRPAPLREELLTPPPVVAPTQAASWVD